MKQQGLATNRKPLEKWRRRDTVSVGSLSLLFSSQMIRRQRVMGFIVTTHPLTSKAEVGYKVGYNPCL